MATIETLRVEYASKIAAQAKADEAALLGMAKAMDAVGDKTKATDEVLKRASQTYGRVVNSVDGVAAATARLERAETAHAARVGAVMDAYRRGDVTLVKAQQDIARLNATFEQTTKKVIDYGNAVEQRFQQAGTAVNTALTTAGNTTQKFTGQTNNASHAVRQLGIQSIDVFQQLASGAPVMTTFIQQGGQIGQVMAVSNTSIGAVAKSIGGFIAANAGIIGATAGMAAFGVATYAVFQRAADLEGQQRTLGVAIAGVGRSAELSTTQLQGYVTQLKQQGIAAAEAQAAVVALSRNSSLSGGAIARIVGLAPDAAAASGQSIQDVTRLMSDAMKGTVDGVQKLDEAFNLLTAAEAASIRTMIEHGDKGRALDDVFAKIGARVSGLNEQALSPIEKAFRDMGNAWSGFMDAIARSETVIRAIERLGAAVRGLASFITPSAAATDGGLSVIDARIAELSGDIPGTSSTAARLRREQAAGRAALLAQRSSVAQSLADAAEAGFGVPPPSAPVTIAGSALSVGGTSKSLAERAATDAGGSDAARISALRLRNEEYRKEQEKLGPVVDGNRALYETYTKAIGANEKAIEDLTKKGETHRTGIEKTADTYGVQIAAAQRLTAAYGVSRAEVTRITAVRDAEEKALSNGLTPGTRQYRDEVEKTTGRILELRRAQGEGKIAEQIRDVDEATEAQLRMNAAYDGTAESLERVAAQEKAHAAALKTGIEPGMREYEATVGKLADSYLRGTRAAEDFRHIQSSVQAVTDILSTAFDRLGQGIVDAFVSGKGAAISFSNIVRSVLASAATSLVQLGAVNPLLNMAGGQQRSSLWTGLSTLTGGGGVSGQATGGLNIMNAASNVSTFGGITDALGLTGFGKQLSGISDYLGLTGSNGILGGVSNGISSILNTPLFGSTHAGTALLDSMGITAGAAGSGPISIGTALSGVGLGFGAGSLAGGFLQSSLGKVGPAPSIGAGVGSVSGALLGSIVPGIGTVLGGLLGGLLGGGGGGLIGPQKATPFSATGLTVDNGMLAVGQTFSQIVDTTAEVQALQQQTAQINAVLAQSNLSIANAVSADEYGQSRLVGGNTGSWLNFGQGDGRPGSIADAFGDLRFTATGNAPLNAYLSGRSFANIEDLQAQVQRITQFVDVTVPALIALGETTKTFGDGSLSANLAELNRQFDDAITTARELGHEETALANARNNAIAATSKAARDLFDQTGVSADIRYFQAQAINDNNPRLAFDANLTAFDIRAKQQRDALSDQLLGILGDAGRTSAEYLDLMAREDRATYAERLSLLTQFNAQSVSADRARGEQSALAAITRLSEYSNSLTFGEQSPLSARDKYSAAIDNFRAVSEGIGQSDFNSLSRLPDVANDLLGASRGLFGSGAQYAADFATVQTVLRGAASQSPENIVAQAIQATEAQQTAVLGSLLEQMIGRLDLLLTETRFQSMKAAA